MNRWVILLFAVCVIFSVEGSIDKLLKVCTQCKYYFPLFMSKHIGGACTGFAGWREASKWDSGF